MKNFVLLLMLLTCSMAMTQSKYKMYFLGDSLTEGYGVSRESSYPYLIQDKLQKSGYTQWEVINSSQSGSTSASLASRVEWILKAKPRLVVLALGANDALRGLKPNNTYDNLSSGIDKLIKNGVKVLLLGMKAPPNYGAKYSQDFEKIYIDLSKKYKITLVPFLLEGVAGEKSLNIEDAIHPNEKGHVIMADTVFKYLKKEL